MNLYTWAVKWGVPLDAIADLQHELGLNKPNINTVAENEADVARLVRIEASKNNTVLMRNNVGATYNPEGHFIRFGLANESSAMNKRLKSSDLIGIKRVTITPEHVGTIIGQFVARETKKPTWNYSGTDREVAQLNFLQLVLSFGGDAAFTTGEGTL